MTAFEALVLGVIEGLTEFLPVSSTGHLTLAAHLLKIPVESDDFAKSFLIVIQLGAILAVLSLYLERFLRDFEVWKRIVVAFIPTGIIGFGLYRVIKDRILGNDLIVVVALVGVGVVLLFVDRWLQGHQRYEDVDQMPLGRALLIGTFQGLSAIFPGTSRSAATIVGGMVSGLSRRAAAEFSFILAVPTMLAASAYDLYKSAHTFPHEGYGLMAIGFVAAFVTALLTVRWLLEFVSRNTFVPFAIYRILIGAVYAMFFLR
ncbi:MULTISPECIES: undecaprenyl-diphosphate phosphatase [unclassified Meiothermus]|uniref:undecaprenyl-diphosphate phosphatase n=1 Tax=unclassified Meiothermus TaxID=370471 RepID=UPI000D7C778A|nr:MULTISPECIES: undecaprenyl-diphosphate phosphatase [unclassified Meiothermus]PZA08908.1 undecaprenyl-diphosphatase [Meiothermus sp. Pnk-1]RYM33223.1 undecaprenyl-diphosphate phosphatase [Meiothermus sp. PNK-Is4]